MQLIRGSTLQGYRELVAELGGDPDGLLRAAGISARDAGARDVFISARSMIRAVEAAAAVTDTADFGLRLSARQTPEILGPLVVAVRTAATTGQGLAILGKFMAAYSNGLIVDVIGSEHPSEVFFAVRIILNPAPPQLQSIELALGVGVQLLRLLIGHDYRPRAVHVPHNALTTPARYEEFFGCPAVFDAPVAGFRINTVDLQRPMPQDELVHQTVLGYLGSTIAGHPASVADSVLAVLGPLLPAGPPTIELVSNHFGLHPKALQRKLAAEGTTFAALLDRVRRDTAHRHLADPGITLTYLTRQLGYAEPAVLTRACQRWFSMTPTQYRDALAADGRT